MGPYSRFVKDDNGGLAQEGAGEGAYNAPTESWGAPNDWPSMVLYSCGRRLMGASAPAARFRCHFESGGLDESFCHHWIKESASFCNSFFNCEFSSRMVVTFLEERLSKVVMNLRYASFASCSC